MSNHARLLATRNQRPRVACAVAEALEPRRLLSASITAADDGFDSSAATRGDDSNDPLDIPWWLRNSSDVSATIVTDTVLGGSTNHALRFSETGTNTQQALIGAFDQATNQNTVVPPNVSLRAAPASQLKLSFNFDFTATPASSSAGLRFGLYDATTITTADNSSNSDKNPGYVVELGTGGTGGTSLDYESGTSGNATNGTDQTSIASMTTASDINDTGEHTAVLTLTRDANGSIDFSVSLDGTTIASGNDASSHVSTFNEIALGFGAVSGMSVDIDNVLLTATTTPATFYVSTAGSNSNNGLSPSTPFQTLSAVQNTMLVPGDLVLLNRSNIFTGNLNLTASGTSSAPITIGAYGTGANPLLYGGSTLSGWTSYTAQDTHPDQLQNGDMEQFGADARNTAPVDWHDYSNGTSYIIKNTTQEDKGAGYTSTACTEFENPSNSTVELDQTTALTQPAGEQLIFTGRYASYANPGMQFNFIVSFIPTSGATEYLQADQTTWSTTIHDFVLTGEGTYQTLTIGAAGTGEFTLPAAGQVNVEFANTYTSAGIGDFLVDNCSLIPQNPASPSPNEYRISESVSPGILAVNGQFQTPGTDPDRLGDNQWIWQNNYLYYRDDAGNPATDGNTYQINSNTSVAILATAKSYIDVDDLSFELYGAQAVEANVGADYITVNGCSANLMGNQLSTGNGVFAFYNSSNNGTVENTTVTNADTDELYGDNSTGLSFLDNNLYLGFGPAADGIQFDFTNGDGPTAGQFVSGNFINQINTPSPKGCIITFGGGIFENNTLEGGQFGVAADCNNIIVRDNVITQEGLGADQSYSAGIVSNAEGSTLSNIQIYDNLITDSINGIAFLGGTGTGYDLWNNTIYNSVLAGISITDTFSGQIENNIIWNPGTTAQALDITEVGTLTSNFNDLGPAATNFITYLTKDYSTLAAYQSGANQDSHSITSDPLFIAPTGAPADFQLQSHSPVIGIGMNVGLTTDLLGDAVPATPDLGAYEHRPTWLAPLSVAAWDAATQTLTVTGASAIVADPASDEPIIEASGSAAIIELDPASGTAIHIGGLSLIDGASAVESSLGSARSATNYHVLVIGVTGATVAPPFTVDSTSTLDLTDNDMIDLYGTGSTPYSTIRSDINGAADGGKWDMPGLTSSVAAADPGTYGLGYAEASALGDTTFDGVTLGGNAVLVKYTLLGDTDLRGSVGIGDYDTVLSNFGTAQDWSGGDFHYGGTVGIGDYDDVLSNFGATVGATLTAEPSLSSSSSASHSNTQASSNARKPVANTKTENKRQCIALQGSKQKRAR